MTGEKIQKMIMIRSLFFFTWQQGRKEGRKRRRLLLVKKSHFAWCSGIIKLFCERLLDCSIAWLTDWLIDCFVWLTRLSDWLTDWLTGCLIDWLIDWLIDRSIDRLIDWWQKVWHIRPRSPLAQYGDAWLNLSSREIPLGLEFQPKTPSVDNDRA